jgi:hypothetical protein
VNEKGITIHLEGMDLAGKSSACRGLAKVLGPGWRVRRNSLCAENPVYELADRLRKEDRYCSETLGRLYAVALRADLEGYTPGGKIIQDSTILLRSLAYHTVAGTTGVVEELRALMPAHPRFTVSVVLTARREARLRRLDLRRQREAHEVAPDDLLIARDPGRFYAMEEILIRTARDCHGSWVIDTTLLSEQDVLKAILEAVTAAGGQPLGAPAEGTRR